VGPVDLVLGLLVFGGLGAGLGGGGGGAGEAFFGGALLVEVEEAGEDLVVEVLRPAVAPGLLLGAGAGGVVVGGLVVVLVVEAELAGGALGEVGPAVGRQDGAVHLGVELAQL
jgi:hypothetical protein